MYGKFFAQAFEGSMYGAGAHVFALWGYVIAHTIDSRVEINPKKVADSIGMTEEQVQKALDYLCAPDSRSRSDEHDGRRLIKEGQFQYYVTNHRAYRNIKNADELREYNRKKQEESRKRRKKAKPMPKNEPTMQDRAYERDSRREDIGVNGKAVEEPLDAILNPSTNLATGCLES